MEPKKTLKTPVFAKNQGFLWVDWSCSSDILREGKELSVMESYSIFFLSNNLRNPNMESDGALAQP